MKDEFALQRGEIGLIKTDIKQLIELANRVTVLRDGEVELKKLIRHLSVSDLLEAMTGRQVVQTFPKRQTYLSNEIVLQAKNLRNNSLKNISFEAKCGEVLGIAGLSGSGRSELLRALMGCDSLDTGHVFLNGNEEGLSINWHENGKKRHQGTYKDGEPVEGSLKFWNSKGKPVDSLEVADKE